MTTQKATTPTRRSLWDVLNAVAKRIKAEPAAYHQGQFKEAEWRCGTACCIAGHMVLEVAGAKAYRDAHYNDIENVVVNRAGLFKALVPRDVYDLVYTTELGVDRTDYPKAYAQAGVRHLRQWMRRHAKVLKSTPVMSKRALVKLLKSGGN